MQPTALQNTPVSCNGGENGAATVSVTGGNIPYSYLWDNGEINATATGLNAGLHAVDITDNKGCTTTATVTITEPAVLAASAAQVSPVCNGESNGSATVTVTGGNTPYSYSWDNAETTATATGLNAGLQL